MYSCNLQHGSTTIGRAAALQVQSNSQLACCHADLGDYQGLTIRATPGTHLSAVQATVQSP